MLVFGHLIWFGVVEVFYSKRSNSPLNYCLFFLVVFPFGFFVLFCYYVCSVLFYLNYVVTVPKGR